MFILPPGKLGCHLDRHENIGRGYLGLETFYRLMNDQTLNDIPLILETPPELSDKEEIDILYSLVKPHVSLETFWVIVQKHFTPHKRTYGHLELQPVQIENSSIPDMGRFG